MSQSSNFEASCELVFPQTRGFPGSRAQEAISPAGTAEDTHLKEASHDTVLATACSLEGWVTRTLPSLPQVP